jgi:hypothetical protein
VAKDKETTKIENAREAGVAMTGKDFKSSASKQALKGLLKSDRSKNTSAMGLAEEEEKRRKMVGYKHGGMVKATGPAKVHKGERVLTRGQAKRYSKMTR